MKHIRYGEKGFTLVELLVVVAILGVLVAVIVPNVGKFIGTGEVEAANTELDSLQTTVVAIIADAGSSDVKKAKNITPKDITQGSSIEVGGTKYALSDYINGTIKGTYSIDEDGVLKGKKYPGDVKWDKKNHCWVEETKKKKGK